MEKDGEEIKRAGNGRDEGEIEESWIEKGRKGETSQTTSIAFLHKIQCAGFL